MEQIKIKKIIGFEKEIETFDNHSLVDKYSFNENEEGINVTANIRLVGDLLYKDGEKIDVKENFDVEFYVFNENIDYTLIHLSKYEILIDGKTLIINMIFDKEKKNISNKKIFEEIEKIQEYKNDILTENINFDELERVINDKDTIMISSLDFKNDLEDGFELVMNENNEDIIEADVIEENTNEETINRMNETNEEEMSTESDEENMEQEIVPIEGTVIKEEKTKEESKESLFKEEYRKTYFYYRMKENDSIELLTNHYRANMDSVICDKKKYKKDDIICIKLK